MTDGPNPTLARRRLAVRLQQARERNERSLDELANQLGVSLPQASRLDSGARGFSLKQLHLLCQWYGLGDSEQARLEVLVAESRRRAWWQQVDLPDAYRTLIGLERGASVINEYCASVMPGLVQLPEYARAAVEGSSFEVTPVQVQQAVEVRMRRQRLFDVEDPPSLQLLIDEAALARPGGTSEVMAAQLRHLLSLSALPRITVQIIGFEAGIHLGATLHFILLEMGRELPDVVYAEGRLEPTDTDEAVVVAAYRRRWNRLRAIALDERSSRERIGRYLHRIESR